MTPLAHLAVLFGLAVSSPAGATTLARLTVDQMTDAADYVVRGNVAEVWTEQDARGGIWTKARIEVGESLKNAAPSELIVESAGGVYGDLVQDVALAARYSVGEDVFLFVCRKGDGDRFGTVAMYGGKYTVRINPADGSEMVVHYTLPYTRDYDARFIPNPPAAERVAFSAIEDQVRARVALGWDGQPIPGASTDRLRAINKLQTGVK